MIQVNLKNHTFIYEILEASLSTNEQNNKLNPS